VMGPMKNSLSFYRIFLLIAAVFFAFLPGGCSREKPLKIHAINVGYGDCYFLELPSSKTMLIDAGDSSHAPAVVRYLQQHNVSTINTVIITHPHKNHFGGVLSVIDTFKVEKVFINGDLNAEEGYVRLLEELKSKNIPVRMISRGILISDKSDSVQIEILHPSRLISSTNANSIVTWIKFQGFSCLFTSDIESREQEELLGLYPQIKQSDVMTVAHHGRAVSRQFIEAFIDKIFIISTGLNPYGPPDQENIDQLKGRVFRTDQHGTIVLESDGRTLKVSHE